MQSVRATLYDRRVTPLDTYVRAILDGRGDTVRQPPPLWSPDALASLARRTLARADRPPWSDPRHLALALRHRLLPRAPPGVCGEGTVPGVIAYDWSAAPKLRGLLVGHGIAHQALRTQPEESNESDAWLLTIELLVPPYDAHPLGLAEIVDRAWAPEWCVRAVMMERRGWILDDREQSSGL